MLRITVMVDKYRKHGGEYHKITAKTPPSLKDGEKIDATKTRNWRDWRDGLIEVYRDEALRGWVCVTYIHFECSLQLCYLLLFITITIVHEMYLS